MTLDFEANLLSIVSQTLERKKPYVDLKQEEIEYIMGDKIVLKVFAWKKILHFGHNGKISPKHLRSYEIIERVGSVAYCLALPSKLKKIHDVFYLSML